MKKVSMSELLPFIKEAFSKDMTFKIPVTGTSMNPVLFEGRDSVLIKKPEFPLEIGDVPLYRRDNGVFVLHRIVDKTESGYIMCGDNQFILEKGIEDRHIIGVMCAVCRDGATISVDDKEWLEIKSKYVRNVKTRYPVRRLKFKLYRLKNGKR